MNVIVAASLEVQSMEDDQGVAPAAADAAAPAEPTIAAETMAAAAETTAAAAPVAAPAAPAVPRLHKNMPREEIATFLKEYVSPNGSKLFCSANFERLEHFSMAGLYGDSVSNTKWQNVTDLLFDGDTVTSKLFLIKVREAKLEESAAGRAAASKLGKAEQKREVLAQKRALDEKGPQEETEEEVQASPAVR
eukprot:7388382-Prymnesium_polylepis.1